MSEVPSTTVHSIPADAFLLDVREPDEWAAGHIDSAVHVPIGEVAERISELPSDQPIAVFCRGGGRSSRATGFLVQNGINAHNVAGGMRAWEAAGHPMVSENGEPPTVI